MAVHNSDKQWNIHQEVSFACTVRDCVLSEWVSMFSPTYCVEIKLRSSSSPLSLSLSMCVCVCVSMALHLHSSSRLPLLLRQPPHIATSHDDPAFFPSLPLRRHYTNCRSLALSIKFKKTTSTTTPAACSFHPRSKNAAEERDVDSDSRDQPIWRQVKEIALFAGPAAGLWICWPLMSLIDTMVIGQGSSLELAALGPGTVLCDHLSYVFMFLSIATSNMVATSLAKKDKSMAQHHISNLLFVSFACGIGMLLFTKFLGLRALTAFTGSANVHLLPAANMYVQIRGFAWPAVLVGMVAQSASLGMKDSWGPLKALAVSSALNGFGHILLCCVWGYGIAGAAWATMLSQVVGAFMMIQSLKKTGFRAYSLSIPSLGELIQIFGIAAPVFITMISKVAFYSLLTYSATSMGTISVAAHQVMNNIYNMCTVWGEPLSQTAQSFMPEFIHGVNPSLEKARMLLKSLVIIGAIVGLFLGAVGTSVPWFFPTLFTTDRKITGEMHKVLLPYFIALVINILAHSLEGTLLAGRELKYLSLSMTGCLSFGGLLILLLSNRGCGLQSCWWALVGFQSARLTLALLRLISPRGMLYHDGSYQHESLKANAA